MRGIETGIQPPSTSTRTWQANTFGIRGKLHGGGAWEADGTNDNDRKHTKDSIDYDHGNLIKSGPANGSRSQANTGGIRGKVRSICGAKVGATYGNDGEHTKRQLDYNR